MAKPKTTRVEGDQSSEFFRMGRKELKSIAQGKTKRAGEAQAELDRRAQNRAIKKAA